MRKLNDKDNEILQKLAPEASIPTHYRSILPPVSMHFAADDEDLQDRLKRLSKEDLKYLAERILDGSECLLCISPEAADMFLDLLEARASSPPAGLKTSRLLLGRCTASTPRRPGCARLDTLGPLLRASSAGPVNPHHRLQTASRPVAGWTD